ncbi:L,D-transpeptidase family protein [Streptomyces daliensis]|uniref:Murein L,D-transpeptidase n=1 Tax=Streptomyces daliensis TaxID=299421 RepID=A0A8T4J8W4_9ACTN|nr:murein L,D-transpeptidase [Streptomyces daliensis]
MAGVRRNTRRAALVAASLVMGVTALTGCKGGAGAAGDAPIRVSKLPEEATRATPSAPAGRESPAANTSKAPAPAAPKPATSAPADPVVLSPGAEGRKVRELQARLRQLGLFDLNPTGYYGTVTAASVKGFQRQQGMDRTGTVTQRAWTALGARTHEPTRSELYPPTTRPLDDPDPRCLTGRALCVSKKSRTLAWMVDGKVRSAMDVRFGSAYTPTREGEFKVDFKSRNHHSTIYDTPMPYAMFFSGGQAVHYSADFAANGYGGASHGCVNVRDKKKIAALFEQVRKGDKVVVYK